MRVQVLADIPRLQDERFFTYQVPLPLQNGVMPGKRVLIPLGNQVARGIIFEVEPGNEVRDLKPIMAVLDQEPVLSSEMLALARWMAHYYMAPLMKVVKAMLPSALDDPRKEILVPGESAEKPLPPEINEKLGCSWKNSNLPAEELAELLRNGLVKVEVTGNEEPYSTGVQYVLSPGVSEEVIARVGKKAPRQARALKFFREQQVPVPERRAVDAVGASVLKRLVAKGLIEREEAVPGIHQDPLLNQEQARAVEQILAALDKEENRTFLLFGVTGSGKTEVYLQALEHARRKGKQSLVLIPEIGLTQQVTGIFEQRLGPRVSVLHSRLNDSERVLEWLRTRRGEPDVVVGARSAVFAPFKDLGLIIIDEEQEPSFHQEENPRYHAREVAMKRAELNNAVVVLCSATPSLESFHRAQTGEYELLRLNHRIASSGQRDIRIVDIKRNYRFRNQIVSPELLDELRECLRKSHQAIVFINRRGYSTTVVCPLCGHVLTCKSCEVALIYHRDIHRVVCHYWGKDRAVPRQCPRCQKDSLRFLGTGSQKVEEELRTLLPEARIIRMDTDSTRGRGDHERIIKSIRERKVDIVVGTQMIAKGFDFPGVAAVGVVNADPLLGLPDFRARERAFQLLVQVAGRAGRGSSGGQVIIQTLEPEDIFFKLVQDEDYEGFYREEIAYRSALSYPPFTHLVKLMFTGPQEDLIKEEADYTRTLLEEMTGELDENIDILGPAPCIRRKIKNRYRYQILLKSPDLDLMRGITRCIIDRRLPPRVRLDIDVDPLAMI